MEEEKKQNISIPQRIWKIGSLTTGVSSSIIGNKIKNKLTGSGEKIPEINPELAQRIVKVLGELKGPWMKIGQYLSLHDTSTGDEFFQAFRSLHYDAPSMGFYFARLQIEKELGSSPEIIFSKLERKPVGSASIGQVHEGFLKTGERVAVKIQYPEMEKIVKSDLTTLKVALAPFKLLMKDRLDSIINEVQNVITNELDYSREADNIELFTKMLANQPQIIIPKVYRDFSSQRVLTMEFISGKPLENAIEEENFSQEVRNHFAKTLVHSIWTQLFQYRTIHADPHPGNFLYVNDQQLALLDFGCTKSFDEQFINNYKELLRAIIAQDSAGIRQAYVDFGFVGENEVEKQEALEEFSYFMAFPYLNRENFDLASNLERLKQGYKEFRKMAEKVGFRVPKDFIYLNRTLFGLGMILFKLGANLNFYDEMEPYLYS